MGSTSKRARVVYNPVFKQGKAHKTGKGDKELLKQHKTLMARIAREGKTKWLDNALAKLLTRMKKAGIAPK
jgi:phage shock protein A